MRDGVALAQLALAPAPAFELPPAGEGHTRHFMPPADYGPTSLVVDAFGTVDPKAELRVWWDVALAPAARDALARAAAGVGYLGRSESVCSMRLVEENEGEPNAIPVEALEKPERDLHGERVELLDIAEGTEDPLGALRVSVTELRRARTLTPPGTRTVPYAVLKRVSAPVQAPTAVAQLPSLAHFGLRAPTLQGSAMRWSSVTTCAERCKTGSTLRSRALAEWSRRRR